MAKEYRKIFIIPDDTIFGMFPTEDYEYCTFIFKNCTFVNFEFCSRMNSIEIVDCKFCEKVKLDARNVVIKESLDTNNLESLSINGKYFRMPEGTKITASKEISIASDIQSLKNNTIEGADSLTLQSTEGTTTYQNCHFKAKYGIKISMLKGNLKLENSEVEVTDSNVKEHEDNHMNGISIACYGKGTHMYLLNNNIKTDVLNVNHPNYIVVKNTELYKVGEHGRFLSRNQEHFEQLISHSYIDYQTVLDSFYKSEQKEKVNQSKILQLFSSFKKSA